jgi:hypothetical protein
MPPAMPAPSNASVIVPGSGVPWTVGGGTITGGGGSGMMIGGNGSTPVGGGKVGCDCGKNARTSVADQELKSRAAKAAPNQRDWRNWRNMGALLARPRPPLVEILFRLSEQSHRNFQSRVAAPRLLSRSRAGSKSPSTVSENESEEN